MLENIKNLSLSALILRLHEALVDFKEEIGELIEENSQIGYEEIKQLRNHITHKLQNNQEVTDSKKLLHLLDLFTTDKAIIDLVKEDSEAWLDLIDAIEHRVNSAGEVLTKQEKADMERIKQLTSRIKVLLRER